jgi:signal transduction histidine kinase
VNSLRASARAALRDLEESRSRESQVLEAMPLPVAVYGQDMKPQYFNRQMAELVGDGTPARPDIAGRRTLERAIRQFAFKRAGSEEPYPLEETPAYRALHGVSASADDVEMGTADGRIRLEAWASPLSDAAGQVEAAILVLSDVTERKRTETELQEHRQHLEELVQARTAELEAANKELRLHLQWLDAIGQFTQVVARAPDPRDVYERICRITRGLFGSQDAFILEWDGVGQEVTLKAHSCKHDHHLVPGGSLSTLPPKALPGNGAKENQPLWISEFWGDDLTALPGELGNHVRASHAGTVVLVSMPVGQPGSLLLGLEMPGWTAALTERETQLLRLYAVDIARVIENARLFEQAKTLATIEERSRLARDLHDSVAQGLYGISLFADASRMALQSKKLDTARQHLQELFNLTRQAMLDMRLLIFELRPPVLDHAGLAAALQARLDSVERKSGFRAVFRQEGEPHLAPQQDIELYRIAHEALNNVIKHAHASGVRVELIENAGTVRMTVQDDGIGFDPELEKQKGGQGLRGMRERAERIGARLSIEAVEAGGSRVTVEVGP